jgi:hypothetical protein
MFHAEPGDTPGASVLSLQGFPAVFGFYEPVLTALLCCFVSVPKKGSLCFVNARLVCENTSQIL